MDTKRPQTSKTSKTFQTLGSSAQSPGGVGAASAQGFGGLKQVMTTPSLLPVPGVAPVPTVPKPVAPKLKEQGAAESGEQITDSAKYEEADKVAREEGDEYWENYAREIELEKEIEELGGVEKIESGEVAVPADVAAEMGITPTVGPQTSIATATGFTVRGVAMSDDDLAAGLSKPTSTGLRWLVEWFIYHLLKAHYHIKKIHGKIFRVKEGVDKK